MTKHRSLTPYTVNNILVVEDNPGDVVLVQELLNECFPTCRSSVANRFSKIPALFEDGHALFDCILLDLTLPDKKGEDLIGSVMALAKSVPVIILTGVADFDFGVHSLSLGIADYLLKDLLTVHDFRKSITHTIERSRIMQDLNASKRRYDELFQLSPQPMWVYNFDTLAFLDVNQAAVESYGYSREQFLGMTIVDVRPPEDVGLIMKVVRENQESQNDRFKGTFRHRKRDGEILMVEVYSRKLKYHGVQAKLVLVNDITERLRHIEAIEQQNQALREIAWLHSHVIRTPVARIMGLLRILESEQATEEELLQAREYLHISIRELDSVIKDIVDKTARPQ